MSCTTEFYFGNSSLHKFCQYKHSLCIKKCFTPVFRSADTKMFSTTLAHSVWTKQCVVNFTFTLIFFTVYTTFLTVAKTNFVVFNDDILKRGRRSKISIDFKCVQRVENVEFLDIYIDSMVPWHNHVCNFSSHFAKVVVYQEGVGTLYQGAVI